MKKILLILAAVFISLTSFAQESKPDSGKGEIKEMEPAADTVKHAVVPPPEKKAVVGKHAEAKSDSGMDEIKQLQATRDTAKAELRRKTLETTKDNNRFSKLENDKGRFKDALKAAKKTKKDEKIQAAQTKMDDNLQAIKDLQPKLKEDDKEVDRLEKEVKIAEKALEKAKAEKAKEKAKAKK